MDIENKIEFYVVVLSETRNSWWVQSSQTKNQMDWNIVWAQARALKRNKRKNRKLLDLSFSDRYKK